MVVLIARVAGLSEILRAVLPTLEMGVQHKSIFSTRSNGKVRWCSVKFGTENTQQILTKNYRRAHPANVTACIVQMQFTLITSFGELRFIGNQE